jgi:hypothetical protein
MVAVVEFPPTTAAGASDKVKAAALFGIAGEFTATASATSTLLANGIEEKMKTINSL